MIRHLMNITMTLAVVLASVMALYHWFAGQTATAAGWLIGAVVCLVLQASMLPRE